MLEASRASIVLIHYELFYKKKSRFLKDALSCFFSLLHDRFLGIAYSRVVLSSFKLACSHWLARSCFFSFDFYCCGLRGHVSLLLFALAVAPGSRCMLVSPTLCTSPN